MKSQALIQETILQLSQKFVPRIPDIKKVCDTHTIFYELILKIVIGN